MDSALLIEAYADLRVALTDSLRAAAVRCESFENVAQAAKFWTKNECVVVVDDVAYSSIFRLTQERAASTPLPVIVMTCAPEKTFPGAAAIFVKPFEVGGLIREICRHCASR